MRNSVLVAVVSAVVAMIVVVCGIFGTVEVVSNANELDNRAELMEMVGVDTTYYSYCDAVDKMDSLEVLATVADSARTAAKDVLLGIRDLSSSEFKSAKAYYDSLWSIANRLDREYRDARIDVKLSKCVWLNAQDNYDDRITELRSESTDYRTYVIPIWFGVGALLLLVLNFYAGRIAKIREDKEKEAYKNRTIVAFPIYIMENNTLKYSFKRAVVNECTTMEDLYDCYIASCDESTTVMDFATWERNCIRCN